MTRLLVAVALGALAGCSAMPELGSPREPVRFLLTFDDGPATWAVFDDRASTVRVLETLAENPVQPGIKAIFFVQTRAWNAGGTQAGRALLQREHAEGHLLAVHTGTRGSHESHLRLASATLEQSLGDAKSDIAAIAGRPPLLVRPPYWAYDEATLDAYLRAGLDMLLTDLSARDGVVWGVNFTVRKRSNLRAQLAVAKRKAALGELPVVDGVIPIVATFHDVNAYTARNLAEYLAILVEEAQLLGLRLAPKPFYDRREDLEHAARRRAFQTPRHDRTGSYNFPLSQSPDLP